MSARRITWSVLSMSCVALVLGLLILASSSSGNRQLLRAGARLKYHANASRAASHPVIQRCLAQVQMVPDSMVASVDMSRCQITLHHIKLLKKTDHVEILVLYDSGLTDELAANLPVLPELREVDLSHTMITDSGLERLARQPRLVEVDVSFTHLTDAGIEKLLGIGRISRLGVSAGRLHLKS